MSVVTAGGFVTVYDGTTNPGVIPSYTGVGHTPDPFQIIVNPSAPLNQAITLKVTLTDGAWTYDQFIVIYVNVDYINIAINDVATSITSKGLIGYNANSQAQGLGFTYLTSTTLLYEGAFMIGASSANVNDMARGTGANPDVDFASQVTVMENGPTVSDMDVSGYFRDNVAATPLPVRHHYAYAWTTSPNRKYVMVKYVIQRQEPALVTCMAESSLTGMLMLLLMQPIKRDVDNTNRMGHVVQTD